jgi:GT2 family glycosyltransferase
MEKSISKVGGLSSFSSFENNNHSKVVGIVVTFNRKFLLINCLKSLFNQSLGADILIVNNASTDGTFQLLKSSGYYENAKIYYLELDKNTGGAGGFYYGLKYAIENGWEWFWLMDDDAEPDRKALEYLVMCATNKNNIYGSAAISEISNRIKLCFPVKKTIDNNKQTIIDDYNYLQNIEEVLWLPFLGFFINRKLVQKIGLPDKDFFIRNDDVEYSERAKLKGAKIYLVKNSVIRHPYQPSITFKFFGRPIYYRHMDAWKVYYEVRNKLIIAKRYYSIKAGFKSFMGISFQVVLSVLIERDKLSYIIAYLNGIKDGLKHPRKLSA